MKILIADKSRRIVLFKYEYTLAYKSYQYLAKPTVTYFTIHQYWLDFFFGLLKKR